MGRWLLMVALLAPQVAPAEGEPTAEGVPSPEERAVFVLTNAARADPQAWCRRCGLDCADFPVEGRRPFAWSLALSRSARFHAAHLHDGPCFQHESCCELERAGDEVRCVAPPDPACALCGGPTSCAGTDAFDRMALFGYPAGSGENIAAGRETPEQALCAWLDSPGHRANIFADHAALGVGHHQGSGCFGRYWVQAFGAVGDAPRIPGGAWVEGGELVANYLHEGGSVPLGAAVVVDGECVALWVTWGSPIAGSWAADVGEATTSGCHRYFFVFTDSDGVLHRYPDTGALVFGEAACPAFDASVTDDGAACAMTGSPGEGGGEAVGCGCASAGGGLPLAGVLLAVLALRLRRSDGPR